MRREVLTEYSAPHDEVRQVNGKRNHEMKSFITKRYTSFEKMNEKKAL
jgi:hypothetical protein